MKAPYFVLGSADSGEMLRSIVARTVWNSRAPCLGASRRWGEGGGGAQWTPAAARAAAAATARPLHGAALLRKAEDRKEMLASMPARDEGTEGEAAVDVDANLRG